jgi:hypothetical protein
LVKAFASSVTLTSGRVGGSSVETRLVANGLKDFAARFPRSWSPLAVRCDLSRYVVSGEPHRDGFERTATVVERPANANGDFLTNR